MTAADLGRGGSIAHLNRRGRLGWTKRSGRNRTRQIGLCIGGKRLISQGARTAPALALATCALAAPALAAPALATRILAACALNRMKTLCTVALTTAARALATFVPQRARDLDRLFGRLCRVNHVSGYGLGRCIASGNRGVFGLRIHAEGFRRAAVCVCGITMLRILQSAWRPQAPDFASAISHHITLYRTQMTSPSLTSAAAQNPPIPPAQPPAQAPKTRQFKFFRVTAALMMREIASTDSRISLGFLWQIIEPVATITVMTLLFQMLTRNPPLGTNFPLFYVTGLLPFQVFQSVGNKVSSAVRFSRPLLEFPAVSVLDAIVARFVLNFVIECAIFVILVSLVIWTYQLRVTIDIPRAAESMVLAGFLALGIGTFNSVLFLAFPIYDVIWGVITRPLMLVSGVLFLIDAMPPTVKYWMLWNPVAHVVGLMRGAFYPGADISYVSPMYLIMISLITLSLGLVTLRRFFRDALDR